MEPFFYLHAELEQVRTWKNATDDCGSTKRVVFNEAATPTTNTGATTTTLSLFGKDLSGETIIIRIHGFRITFYVSFKDAELNRYCCMWLANNNENKRIVSIKSVTGFESMMLDKDREITTTSNYADTTLTNVIKLQVRTRRDVAEVIETIDERVYSFYRERRSCSEYSSAVKYYHSNMDCIALATRGLGLDACCWCFLNTDLCRRANERSDLIGREYHFTDDGIVPPERIFITAPGKEPTPLPKLPPPVKIMSFDIECLSSSSDGKMPDAERDPIIQISSVISEDALGRRVSKVTNHIPRDGGNDEQNTEDRHVFHRHLFTLGGVCNQIQNVEVQAFSTEKDMLNAFIDHVHTEDPDIVTGYNINTFDFPYLFRRIEEQGGLAATIGRGRKVATCKKAVRDLVSQYASFRSKTHTTIIPGRIGFDMYAHVRKEVDLRSYTLNSVATHFLNKCKDDVDYREIPTLFNGDADSRARLGHYCVKDAQLVLELAFKMHTFVHAFERCKVFRIMLQYLVDRGQQIKMYSMLLAWCSQRNILVNDITSGGLLERKRKSGPAYEADVYDEDKLKRRCMISVGKQQDDTQQCINHGNEDVGESEDDERLADASSTSKQASAAKTKRTGYDGAIVLDPIPGIYHTPVVCLDYASLYPSIMIGYNLCFTTWVPDNHLGRRLCELGMAEESPIGQFFLKRSIKKGVLPSILEMLLYERADVRKNMKNVPGDSFEYNLLDAQQHTLKIAANSIYGAIGCEKSVLNLVAIPASVTAYGRRMILQTKQHVEEKFADTRVVYGDTDSVMVNLTAWESNTQRIWECAKIGGEMAASVTNLIDRKPIRLQFETVYKPFLLCTKKRYAAGVYGDLEKIAAMDDEEAALQLCRPRIKYKGLQVVRRDSCRFATRQMCYTLEMLMDESNDGVGTDNRIEKICDTLREQLKLLFAGQVDMAELEITKEWKKKGGANAQIHDKLAQKMQQRDPNSAPSIGDRVAYVVIDNPMCTQLSQRGEDPRYVKENGLQLDFLYYAENQVAKPIAELLRLVLGNEKPLETIKDKFWPDNAPRRRNDKRRKPGDIVWTRKASVGSRRVTDYFKICSE